MSISECGPKMSTHTMHGEGRQSTHSQVAAILVDSQGTLSFPGKEALRILLYPRRLPNNRKAQSIALQRVRALFPDGPLADTAATSGEFLSGRRGYLYRLYQFGNASGGSNAPAAMIVLERRNRALAPRPDSLAPYHLTTREQQVLLFVLQGLSNKRIAENMGISPNTVKSFLRLIMTKLGVRNRFTLFSKLLGQVGPQTRRTSVRVIPRAPKSRVALQY